MFMKPSSVTTKIAMALSGAVLSGWVMLHMAGNLLVFLGPELINEYGRVLQGSPLIWLMRVGLSLTLIVHLIGAAALTRRARRARARYRRGLKPQISTVSSRSMRWGGLAVGLFLVYHLAHIFGPAHTNFIAGDVHHNLVAGLADPLAGGFYIAATIVFGLHLHHGTWSLFRTLGHEGRFETGVRRGTSAFSAVVTVGFLAPCVAALAGWLG